MDKRPLLASFRAKVILFAIAVAVTASGFVAASSYWRFHNFSRQSAIDALTEEVKFNADRLAMPFTLMQRDIAALAGTPPIQGLVRAIGDDQGIDPLDGSTTDQWRHRLETIFISFMKARPQYTQLRYIALADGGRELVRVDNIDEAPHPIVGPELQEKGSEPYMRPLYDPEAGAPYFSRLTLNREHGQVAPGEVPTIRFILPIKADGEAVVTALVVNLDYRALLEQADLHVAAGHTVSIVTDQGDHITFDSDGSDAQLFFHELADWQPFESPLQIDELNTPFVLTDTMGVAARRLPIVQAEGISHLTVISTVPTSVMLEDADAMLQSILITAATTLAAVLLVAWAFGAWLTRPLTELTKKITAHRDPDAPIALDASDPDEIGDLARAFTGLSNTLIERSSEARMVYRDAADGILTINRDGTIRDMNPACLAMFGYEEADVVGKNVSILVPPELRNDHDAHLQGAANRGRTFAMAPNRDVEGQRANGQRFPLEVSISQVSTSGVSGFVGVVRDISVRKSAEEAQARLIRKLKQATDELTRSNRELDNFAYIASHDLKAPLRVIANASRWLEEDLEEHLDEDSRENMELLRGRVARMERLLSDLLEHSRIGRVDVKKVMVPGAQLAADVVELAAVPEAFRVEIGPGFEQISLPRMPLLTVLVNLVSNAVKHHDRGEGTISLSVSEAPDHFEITVEDDGPGIPAEFQEKAFGMFQTLQPRDSVEGSGMGLAIVRKTVEVAGGTISLVSGTGRGCSFRITWPKTEEDGVKKGEAA